MTRTLAPTCHHHNSMTKLNWMIITMSSAGQNLKKKLKSKLRMIRDPAKTAMRMIRTTSKI